MEFAANSNDGQFDPSAALLHEGKILIVDDDPVNIAILERILRREGYHRIDSTIDPSAVRTLYDHNHYDLVVLDVHMPVWSGFDVLQQLSQDNPDDYLPVLVLTSDDSVKTQHRCLASGAKDFISKPFKRDEVLLRVRNIIEVRLLHKQLREHNEALEEKVLERTQQLYNTQLKLIDSLAGSAEYRDHPTNGSHVSRIGQYAAIVGRELGLNRAECELLRQASPMHDLGTIAIPEAVLMKTTSLSAQELETVRSHTEIGARMLGGQDSELLSLAADIAQTHHERWDGSGYPSGLEGEEIPLHSRIVAVCDVFDALTSDRPYRQRWKVSKALNYLQQNAGTEFDPKVVACFEQVLDQILACREADLGEVRSGPTLN